MASDRASPTTNFFFDLLYTNRNELGLEEVYYGDQNLIGNTPSVAVEPGPFSRTLEGGGVGGKGRTENITTVFFLIYIARLDGKQDLRRELDVLSESIVDKLHEDMTAGGSVIHGYVTAIDPGYAKRGSLMLASRLTWRGINKSQIV